jgi:hypothetical protein
VRQDPEADARHQRARRRQLPFHVGQLGFGRCAGWLDRERLTVMCDGVGEPPGMPKRNREVIVRVRAAGI